MAAPGVTGAAYTNNDFNQASTGTTLFDLDTTLDQIVIQSPPGNGILVATGKLGVDAGAVSGFDIYSQLRAGIAISNHALAVLAVERKLGALLDRAHHREGDPPRRARRDGHGPRDPAESEAVKSAHRRASAGRRADLAIEDEGGLRLWYRHATDTSETMRRVR